MLIRISGLGSDKARVRAVPDGGKRACLVVMPFTSSWMPAMGASLLKATLLQAGIATDLYYGAPDFFRHFTKGLPVEEALLDYNILASFNNLGDLFFADTLWGDRSERVRHQIERIADIPNPNFSRERFARSVERIRGYLDGAAGYLERCLGARDWGAYDVIGFSSTFSQNVACLTLARAIRARHPEVHIVFGGANCEGDMGVQLLRSFPYVDTVIQGEADTALPRFIERLRAGRATDDIPGIVFRKGGDVLRGAAVEPLDAMDSLPFADFSDYFEQMPAPILAHLRERREIAVPLETSRGCWWGAIQHCVFCGLNSATMRFRSKSPERALEETLAMRDRHGVDYIYVVDNIIDLRYLRTFLPRLEGEGLRLFYETKSNLEEEDVHQFARAGVRLIQPGVESLDSAVLKLMKKGVKAYHNLEVLKWCSTYGVKPLWLYLYGFAHEPVEGYLRVIELIERLVHLEPPKGPNPVLMDRYSPYFTQREALGFRNIRPLAGFELSYRGLDDEERFNLSYHFHFDLPQGSPPYEKALLRAIEHWITAHRAGARFYQFKGERTTLLVDTRRAEPQAFLLSGVGHRIHDHLRRAHGRAAIVEAWASASEAAALLSFSFTDLYLVHVAQALGAEMIASPEREEELDAFLAGLVERWIAIHVDDRWLGLSVDCTDEGEAARFGLVDVMRRLDVEAGGSDRRSSDELRAELDLVAAVESAEP
ncbi:RiPP maturation radical SAM C-methyltransferase [Chondromyces crocatus]|uniref:B12-binding domain-containing protein n=1 Tax=Chondromyces crocatus TaxID=52 RepID=A0A0K1EJD9_CHOCO|nr:RiPP maturation radical SAM C-methyltransferase [Chondromyces crocatus]AKT40986.1 uncharacterized protein CMC5_051430 [Chondromyces crocatus]